MLYDIVLILVVLTACYFSFRLGFKSCKGIDPKIDKPAFKRKYDKKTNTLLANIENYDGTPNNQKKL